MAWLILNKKNYSNGLDRCQESIRICPIYTRAYFVLGSIFSKKRDFTKAEFYLQNGLKLQNDNIIGIVNLGAVYSILKKYNEAIVLFERATSLSPKESKAYLGLGKIYAAQGDIDNANRCFKAVIKLDPEGKLGLIAKRSIQASNPPPEQENFEHLSEIPEELYALGYQYYLNGDLGRAVSAYKKYLSLKKTDADVWASLASTQIRLGQTDDAISSIKNAIALNPKKASHYKIAAIIYDAANVNAELNQVAKKAIDLGRRDSITLTLLGKSFYLDGNLLESIETLQEAINYNSNNLKARYYLAQTYKSMGQTESAKKQLEEIIWAKSDSPLKEKAKKEIKML